IDDYHLIEDQTLHESLLFLLERLPAHFHLVLASRIDPPLALARWRVRGQLLELRDSDLRFHEEEAARFFTQAMSLPLSSEDSAQLTLRTEGWIAGLQLAALSMRHRKDLSAFVQSFTGSHRHVLDYVQEEILARLPLSLQHFLPQIAILNKISAPLCQAITGEAQSRTLLEQAERTNLFLVPLDEERRCYRMHDLFRGALLAHLRARQPEMLPLLHQQAARFYRERGELHEAISHTLAAEDFWSAARLMEQTLEEVWLSGESQTLYQWIMILPAAVIRKHARFALAATLYALNLAASIGVAQARTRVEQMMGRIEEAMSQGPTMPEAREEEQQIADTELMLLQRRLFLLRLLNEVQRGNASNNFEVYRRAVTRLQQLDLKDDMSWQMIPLSITFIWRWTFLGEGTSLIPMFKDAWEQARQSGNRFVLLKVQQWLLAIYLKAGKLDLVYQEGLAALNLIAQIHGYTLLGGYISLWLADVLQEWNRLDEARNLMQKLAHDAQIGQQLDLQLQAYFLLLEVELAAGQLASAQQVMEQLTALIQETSWDQESLPLMQVTYWLGTGDLAQAAHWAMHAASHQEAQMFARRLKLLLLARVSLSLQQYHSALDILAQHREVLDQREDLSSTISFLALSVAALYQVGERAEAQTTLTHLLTLTEQEGYVRLYLDQGLPMQEAIQNYLNTPPGADDQTSAALRAYASRLLAIFAQEKQERTLRRETQSGVPQAQTIAPAEASSLPAFLEPLTSQEQRVLRLLAAGRTNQEIARLLVISPNTVKTHVKNLYSKLHVSSRAQASALARALRLL
ncbi:MAG TPA: LuxR C-terminal-related transcriptional regulator, partial [Ktedonobacteraceae bacterium]|nr:LuxR C-terminal-related transcriptional regulator [Ktedonobacteraceae bacterium]